MTPEIKNQQQKQLCKRALSP